MCEKTAGTREEGGGSTPVNVSDTKWSGLILCDTANFGIYPTEPIIVYEMNHD